MISARFLFRGCLVAAVLVPTGGSLAGQVRGIEVSYGRWWQGGRSAQLYALTFQRPWIGPFSYGIGLTHVEDPGLLGPTQTGGEFSVAWGRRGGGLYGVGATGVVMRHGGGSLDGIWSAGVGYGWQPLSFVTLGGELRYRIEMDRWTQGFWHYDEAVDRRGLQLQARMSLHFGGARRTARPPRTSRPAGVPRATSSGGSPRGGTSSTPTRTTRVPTFDPPRGSEVEEMARANGASESTASLAASVVRTAMDVMGTPYQWGGTDENGFDCSGLIQYAYAQNGIIIPRISRDQARYGDRVDARVVNLRPGDVLGFSVERSSRITHVGLYIGDGQFIHSSSQGVRISSLTSQDPDSRWWQRRWVVARRIL